MIYVLLTVAIIIGALMPVQAGINAELTRFLKHPYFAAFISFFIGAFVLGVIVLSHGTSAIDLRRLAEAPPRLFLGGIFGALFVASSIFFIPRLGATTMIAAFVTGQLVMSVIIDHYGMMGLPTVPVTPIRLFGILLLFAGLFLVLRKGA